MEENEILDPLEETRKNREELAKKFGYDMDKLYEYIREQQAKNTTHKIVTKEELEKAG